MTGGTVSSGLLAVLLVAAPAGARAKDQCADVDARFAAALTRHDLEAAIAIESEVATGALSAPCGGHRLTCFRTRRATVEMQDAEALKDRPDRQAEREKLIFQADQPQVLWQAAYRAGQILFAHQRYAEAAEAFNRSLRIAEEPEKPDGDLKPGERQELVDWAFEAKALTPEVVAVVPTRDGTVPGYRGVEQVPMPIRFESDRADLTSGGRAYAVELATAIKRQRTPQVILEGHTDDRGSDAYNDVLSRRRAETVAAFVRAQGVTVEIVAVGKGKREPYHPRSTVTAAQLREFNRRVVWRRAG